MRHFSFVVAASIALSSTAYAQDQAGRSSSEAVTPTKTHPSPNTIVEAAPESAWVGIDPENLLVMTLAPDADGTPREVIIQLMPAPFSQGWVSNIRTLARAKWYDGISVNRVQDNYVVQWGFSGGDPNGEDEAQAKPLPDGLKVMGEENYVVNRTAGKKDEIVLWHPRNYFEDSYSNWTQFEGGWPVASNIEDGTRTLSRWPVHCYGMVGVGRGYSPDTGSGAELYTVIGHAPRHLDRNIALVGRIISGMEHLSSMKRGTGPLGFYTEEEAGLRTPIQSIRVVSDLLDTDSGPVGATYSYEYLSTESESFAKYAEARANRHDPFFIQPAGGADICNIPVPIRPAPNG